MARKLKPKKSELTCRKWSVVDGKHIFKNEVPYDVADKYIQENQHISGLTIVTSEASKRIRRLAESRKRT